MRERSALAGLAGGSASSWENRFPGRQKKERFNWEEALQRETAIPFRAKHGPGERFISKGPDNEALRHARPGRLGEALQPEKVVLNEALRSGRTARSAASRVLVPEEALRPGGFFR